MPNPNAGYQEELFREFSPGAPGARGRFRKEAVFSAKTVSFEQILFGVIGVLIALVLAFSLGVERGKQVTKNYEILSFPVARIITPAPAAEEKKEAIAQQPMEETKQPVFTLKNEEKETKVSAVVKNDEKGYTIQVVTYRDKKSAERLIGEFRTKGQKSFMLPKGELLAICIGEYPTSSEATKAAKGFKKQFPDCFVRKL
ncbi:MAG: SPOR domain-containing protein [Candidatus Omnitrophica bacterium]|nr:SPOR domain-containing protein [Candidatus Omnitrophota bacterium]